MKRWLYIVAAVCSEVMGSLSLRAAQEHPAWYVPVAVGFVASFVFLSVVLRLGVPIGVAYGIWGALGISLTAVLSTLIFGEPFTAAIGLGITLIVIGVLLIELGSHSAGGEAGGGRGRGPSVSWLYLALAVVFEIAGTMSLRQSEGLRKRVWIVPVVAAYLASFAFLSLVLSAGMSLGVAYGIWAALGISLTALISRVLFGEPLTWVMALGIAACVGGVLLVEIG